MRNATSILLFGASSLVLTIAACGGGGDGTNRDNTAGSSSAGTPANTAGTPANTSGSPATGGSSTAGSGTGGATGGAAACMPVAGPKNGGDGSNKVIDDIDDANTMFAPAGMGVGTWDFSKDASPTGMITPASTAMLVPVDGGQMGKALHVTGTGLTGWGAALAAILNGTASSFDASAFGGVAFYIKGTSTVAEGMNKVFITARMYELIPGAGSCCKETTPPTPGMECYATHRVVVDLPADWAEVKIAWSDLKAATYGLGQTTTFNPNRLRDIVFSFNHEGTMPADGAKFDVWVDGLRFLGKDEMGNVGGGMGGSSSGGSSSGGGGAGGAAAGAGGAAAGVGGT
jgi:hypothetical protein